MVPLKEKQQTPTRFLLAGIYMDGIKNPDRL